VVDPSRDKQFRQVKFKINDIEIPIVKKCKLLGTQITNNVKWEENVNYTVKKANSKMFILRRLKLFKLSETQLINVYKSYIRSLLEYSSVVWGKSLTVKQNSLLTSIEKRSISIITGKYISRKNYTKTCKKLNLETLVDHRDKLLNTFGKKLSLSERFTSWLKPYIIKSERSRRSTDKLREITCKRVRYEKSTIPSILKNLNKDIEYKIPNMKSLQEIREILNIN